VADFNIASSVILICAERLVRKLCPHCKSHTKEEQRSTNLLVATFVTTVTKAVLLFTRVMPITIQLASLA
jgi:type II secretory ATPase GspE/PulE/Tfp pilus assembly ATPase PilB-like protein